MSSPSSFNLLCPLTVQSEEKVAGSSNKGGR